MVTSILFDNSYSRLPDRFFARLPPVQVSKPGLIKVNRDLAANLRIDPDYLESEVGVQMLAGNMVPDGAEPIAMAYAGHQFGGWVPSLGDGRALLLGEVVGQDGVRWDIQLKGSGPTPFSRSADGRAWVGPVIREYIVSEAMHALGIPSTRALAAVTTGEPVYREAALPGAVLTRISSCYVRVGTFQYFYARNDIPALRTLADYLITRLYPHVRNSEQPILSLLKCVVARQAQLIAGWMGVGFIHGVMNTDNMSLAGETIDFGPCAFMDGFHPHKVFSSIDHGGRYAYSNQPLVGLWNLSQFATTLIPLLGEDQSRAIVVATDAINEFQDLYNRAWQEVFDRKLGLENSCNEDNRLANSFLEVLAAANADFSIAFRKLSLAETCETSKLELRRLFPNPTPLDSWFSQWLDRVRAERRPAAERQKAMLGSNPMFVPRNHRIEQAIAAAVQGDFSIFEYLTMVLSQPYSDQPEFVDYALAPNPDEIVTKTFCGT